MRSRRAKVNWPTVTSRRTTIPGTTRSPARSGRSLSKAEPLVPTVQLRYMVKDVEAAIAFYTTHLGFTLISKTLPAFADIARGDLRLLLSGPASSAETPMADGRPPTPGGWNRIHFIVEDLAAEV